jgi:hypothetical protein
MGRQRRMYGSWDPGEIGWGGVAGLVWVRIETSGELL